jgi:hypothetical protein
MKEKENKKEKSKVAPASSPNDLGVYIASEVARAEQDYQNVRTRALSLVGTSGGLVALVSGLLAIAVGSAKAVVPTDARWTIAVALSSFILSTISALVVNFPQTVTSSDQTKLGSLVECHWDDEGWNKSVAEILVTYLGSLRKNNGRTANWLTSSVTFQILGISFIAVSAFLILLSAS